MKAQFHLPALSLLYVLFFNGMAFGQSFQNVFSIGLDVGTQNRFTSEEVSYENNFSTGLDIFRLIDLQDQLTFGLGFRYELLVGKNGEEKLPDLHQGDIKLNAGAPAFLHDFDALFRLGMAMSTSTHPVLLNVYVGKGFHGVMLEKENGFSLNRSGRTTILDISLSKCNAVRTWEGELIVGSRYRITYENLTNRPFDERSFFLNIGFKASYRILGKTF